MWAEEEGQEASRGDHVAQDHSTEDRRGVSEEPAEAPHTGTGVRPAETHDEPTPAGPPASSKASQTPRVPCLTRPPRPAAVPDGVGQTP